MARLILYLTNEQLAASVAAGKELTDSAQFANDSAGWEAFATWLRPRRKHRAYLLVDLVEEDFQRENLPHLSPFTPARKAMVERRLGQFYRDTPYRAAILQGREAAGRRDDTYLFYALTNAAFIKPWADALVAENVPLAGTYSVGLLMPLFAARLGIANQNLLLVTQHVSGLRQTYFHEGKFRFSRLRQMPQQHALNLATTLDQEAARTRQFLASSRLLAREAPLSVMVLAQPSLLEMLAQLNNPAADYSLQSLPAFAASLGMREAAHGAFDAALMHQVVKRPPATHYTSPEAARVLQQWQTGQALKAATAGVALASMAWVGISLKTVFEETQQLDSLAQDTRVAERRYRAVMEGLPAAAAHPVDMKTTVTLHRQLSEHVVPPAQIAAAVSRALADFPEIRLNRMQWQIERVQTDPAAMPSEESPPPPAAAGSEMVNDATLLGVPAAPGVQITLEGEIAPFAGDYRPAIASIERFAAALSLQKGWVARVESLPLAQGSDAELSGKVAPGTSDERAEFVIRVKGGA